MALFGRSDWNAPLLTQFYQVEFDLEKDLIGSELDIWAGFAMSSINSIAITEDRLPYPEPAPNTSTCWSTFLFEVKNADRQDVTKDLEILSDLHFSVRNILDSFVNGENPYDVDLGTINRWFDKYSHSVSLSHRQGKFYLSNNYIKVNIEYLCSILAVQCVVGVTNQALRGFPQADVAICPECKNPFLRLNPRARQCSRRCSHRMGERRRYAERFAEYKEFRKGQPAQEKIR